MDKHRTKGVFVMSSELQKLVRQVKREAKVMARSGPDSHMQALEILAREHGFSSWFALHTAATLAQTEAVTAAEPVRFAVDAKYAEEVDEASLASLGVTREFDWRPPGEDSWEDEGTYEFFRFEGRQPSSVQEVLEVGASLFWFPPERVWFNGVEGAAVTRMDGSVGIVELPETEPVPESLSAALAAHSQLGAKLVTDADVSQEATPTSADATIMRGTKSRSVTIVVGQDYLVEPFNELKMKHRGRICTVLEFMTRGARVRFRDNNRQGRVDELTDLVPIERPTDG